MHKHYLNTIHHYFFSARLAKAMVHCALPALLALFCIFSIQLKAQETPLPKNIIMIIGDGMGPAYLNAYRYLHDNPQTPEIERTVFDRHYLGSAITTPHFRSGLLTDSAASATALATGVKTYNGAIGVDINMKPLLTVAEFAKTQGKKVGLVATSQINHATPASFFSHNPHRKNYQQIADSYLSSLTSGKLDLALGGGSKYFQNKKQNLISAFTENDGIFLDNYLQLTDKTIFKPAQKTSPVLGLFAETALPKAIDDQLPTRLLAMTEFAINHLTNDKGYFLLIEASQIDWAGHENDIISAMSEMHDLAQTITWLESKLKNSPEQATETLVLITADHDTGGLALGRSYQAWQPELLKSFKHSPHMLAEDVANALQPFLSKLQAANQAQDQHNQEKHAQKSLLTTELKRLLSSTLTKPALSPITLTNKEINKLTKKLLLAQTDIETFKALPQAEQAKVDDYDKPSIKKAIFNQLVKIVNKRTNTGWTTLGHSSVDVPVMAFGAHHQKFKGLQDNTDIAKKIFSLLGKHN